MSPRPVTTRSTPLIPPLQPEDTTAAHKTLPPIYPTSLALPRVTSTVDPQFLLPPYNSTGPPILSLPALNKRAFNAPTEQGPTQVPINVQATFSMTIQDMLNPSDEEVRQSPQTKSSLISSDVDIRPSGNLSRALVSRYSKNSHARRSSTSHTYSRPPRRRTQFPSSWPKIAQKTRAFRPAYSTEEQHFIWYLRIDRGYLWPELLDSFNARFSGNGGRRELSGLQCRYYRLLGQHGIPQVRMLRTADVVQRYGMKASLARAGHTVTYPWLNGQYPKNPYGQVLDERRPR